MDKLYKVKIDKAGKQVNYEEVDVNDDSVFVDIVTRKIKQLYDREVEYRENAHKLFRKTESETAEINLWELIDKAWEEWERQPFH